MKLEKTAIEWAIKSLDTHGDTDLFPKPVELTILADPLQHAVKEISDLDIDNHKPSAFRRFIVPKGDLSYRFATQLDPLDSIILTALVYQFGAEIEKRRRTRTENSVFSYRFSPSQAGNLYDSVDGWNRFWAVCRSHMLKYKVALVVDISDFYNQISHHTLENQLYESGLPNQATKWILRLIGNASSKVSRGIPVGPHASHLLAEASLIPIDNSLILRGIKFCRFVDDIVVFLENKIAAQTCFFQIADILDKQQHLQLQKSKTKILESAEFVKYCHEMSEDRPINDLEQQLWDIIRKHSGGNPYQIVHLSNLSDDDLKVFDKKTIEQIISDYLKQEAPDFIRLRWFLRRLAQVGHNAAVEYCLEHFERLIPAISEVCRYFVSVEMGDTTLNWPNIGERLINLLGTEIVQSNEYVQMSILSLFNRKTQLDHFPKLVARYSNVSFFLRREIILAAAECGHADWLRELKGQVSGMDPWTKRAFFYAARQLPADERKFFLNFVASDNLLEKLIINWAK